MKKNIRDVAKVIRSKNAGPFELTFDIIFQTREWFEYFKEKQIINKKLISELYKIDEADILGIIAFEPAHAIKITVKRIMASGAPGETDIYGAQQHAPLFNIEFEYD
jgi:hypothetical protein